MDDHGGRIDTAQGETRRLVHFAAPVDRPAQEQRPDVTAVAFPAIAALISLACLLAVVRDALRRPKPDRVAWGIAFGLFAVAAGAEVVGSLAGWSDWLARLYYLAGAVLVVGFLALGQLYLLFPRRLAAVGPGVALLVVALAATLVLAAPVDQSRLAAEGWHALRRDGALRVLTISLNAGGTAVIVGGTLYSAWRFWRLRIPRHRLIGCLLIAAGTLIVAAGGSLARLGLADYLYLLMAVGIAVIFAGYLAARRPEAARPSPAVAAASPGTAAAIPAAAPADPALAFIEQTLLPLGDAELIAAARVWSAEPPAADRFDRAQARRAWALRLRLSPAAQAAFDAHSVPARLQLVELYHDVLTAHGPAADAPVAADVEPPPAMPARLTDLGERQPAARGAG